MQAPYTMVTPVKSEEFDTTVYQAIGFYFEEKWDAEKEKWVVVKQALDLGQCSTLELAHAETAKFRADVDGALQAHARRVAEAEAEQQALQVLNAEAA